MAYLRQLFNSGTDPNSFAHNISSSAQRRGRDVVPPSTFDLTVPELFASQTGFLGCVAKIC